MIELILKVLAEHRWDPHQDGSGWGYCMCGDPDIGCTNDRDEHDQHVARLLEEALQ